MRFHTFFLTLLALVGCSTHAVREQHLAVIDVSTEKGCDRPGVRLDAVKQSNTSLQIELKDSVSPVALEPGKYSIAVACQNPLNETTGQCVWWGHPNEYPTYAMSLKAGIRYTFHCIEQNGELVYRISKSNL
jgi:hypothetical protein